MINKIVSAISTFLYELWQGILGILRNSVMSLGSVLALVSCMVILGTFYSVLDIIEQSFRAVDDMNIIVINLDTALSETEVAEIRHTVENLKTEQNIDIIENVEYLSKAENWERFVAKLEADGSSVGELLSGYFDAYNNPLPECIRIKFTSFSDMDKLYSLRYTLSSIDGIRPDDIQEKFDLYDQVTNVMNAITVTGVWILAILLLVTIFIIINTLKLGIHARRNEIYFMRYCGATKAFVRMPFIIEGIIIGIISAVTAFGLQYYIYDFILADIFREYKISTIPEFSYYVTSYICAFAAIGLITGAVGSWVSIKKYLKA